MSTRSKSLCLFLAGIFLLSACTPSVDQSLQVITAENAAHLIELHQWGQGTLQKATFSPDGKLVTIMSGTGVYLYDSKSFAQVHFIEAEDMPMDMAFSNDSSKLAFATMSSQGVTVGLYNVSTGRKINEINWSCSEESPCGAVKVIFSPADTILAIAGLHIQLWDVKNGQKIRTISKNHSYGVAFSHDGTMLAGGGQRGTLKLWDVNSGKEVWTFGKPTTATDVPEPISISFSPDDANLFIEYMPDWHISVLNIESGEFVPMLKKSTRSISSDFTKAVAFPFASNAVTVYDLYDDGTAEPIQIVTNHADHVNNAAFSPDTTRLITTSDDNTAKVWNIITGKELHTFYGFSDGIESMALSPDQSILAVGSWLFNGTIRLLDAKTGLEINRFSGHKDMIFDLDFSPDGTKLASASRDGRSKIWDVKTGQEVYSSEKDGIMFDVAYSPDGEILAMTNGHGVRVIDVASKSDVYSLDADSYIPDSIGFSPDGTTLLWSRGKTVMFLNAKTGQQISSIKNEDGAANSAAFSPNGNLLAVMTSNASIEIWDVSGKDALFTFEWYWTESFAFSPDGNLLAASSWYGDIRIWDVTTGEELVTLAGHSSSVSDILFSADGKLLYSGSNDGTVIVWGVQ